MDEYALQTYRLLGRTFGFIFGGYLGKMWILAQPKPLEYQPGGGQYDGGFGDGEWMTLLIGVVLGGLIGCILGGPLSVYIGKKLWE